MKRYLAAAVILLASAGAAWTQSVVPCIDTDPLNDPSGECAAAPISPGGSASGVPDAGATGTAPSIDPGVTSAIPQQPAPQGMPPLVVPNDPLGTSIGQNPLGSTNTIGGSQGSINGNSGISSPAIQ